MMWRKLSFACVVILGAGAMSAARANSLTGDVITGSYVFPCVTCTLTGGFSYFANPFVVNGTVETALFVGNPVYYSAWDVSFNANSVTLTMAPAPQTDIFYSGDPFNGPVFTILSGNSFGSITGMVVDNPDCVPCNPITAYLSGNSLFINWEGAGGKVGDTITIDFSVGGPVSGPISGAPGPIAGAGLPGLLLVGGGLLIWWGHRRTRKGSAASVAA
jgi:hypothetical protein